MDFFTGQILPLAITYAPKQTAMCSGQLLPVNQNQALFALLGTVFGGTGGAGGTFGLPNTGGRSMIGFGNNGSAMTLGATGGEASHTLLLGEIPSHTHALYASNQGQAQQSAIGAMPGPAPSGETIYGGANALNPLGGAPLATSGGSQPHPNVQPSTAINFAIVLYGVFPTRS